MIQRLIGYELANNSKIITFTTFDSIRTIKCVVPYLNQVQVVKVQLFVFLLIYVKDNFLEQ